MKIVMVLTSHDQLGGWGRKTGFGLEELADPYYGFKDAGVEITLASPKGGRLPLDPESNERVFRTDLTFRFEKYAAVEAQLSKTVRLDSVRQGDFDTVFYPRPQPDVGSRRRRALNQADRVLHRSRQTNRHRVPFHRSVAARSSLESQASVQGKEVTGFTNGEEEEEVGLTKIVPFLVEHEMLKFGAIFAKKANWAPHVVSCVSAWGPNADRRGIASASH